MGPRVLVVLDTAAAWSRGILRGFADVAHAHGWTLLHYHPDSNLEWLLKEFSPAVLAVGPVLRREHAYCLKTRPSISLNLDRSAEGVASVCLDEARIGELALRHLWSRGIKAVTTFRFNESPFAERREKAFNREAKKAGIKIVEGWWLDGAAPPRNWETPEAIGAWLLGLPRPCGVFTCCDVWGRVVARYARSAGLRVPEDLPFIGVDNDTLECELISPPLTSVSVPWRSMGESAAELARRALAGRSIVGQRIVIEPLDVVARRSSDTLAVDDALVKAAVDWIQAHADQRVTVPMVAAGVKTTRQRLERRFRALLGRTVMHEVRRTHVEAAKRLLTTTHLTLPAVASQSGFTTAALLNEAFRRETGVSPGEYRRRARALGAEDT
jgi:LacI family transcriptional regulator